MEMLHLHRFPFEPVSWASGASSRQQAEEGGGRFTHHLQVYLKCRK
jgi:hypothetical protein